MEYACLGDLGHLLDSFKQKRQRIPEAIIWKVISDVSDGNSLLIQDYNISIRTILFIGILNLPISFALQNALSWAI